MLENVTESYTLADASMEIFLMLLGAFVLGMILGWLLKPSKYVTQKVVSAAELMGTSYVANKRTQTRSSPTVKKAASKATLSAATQTDNLQIIEWVGPKLEKLLNKHHVHTFKDVVNTDVAWLEDIILAGWPRYQVHSPTTWPDQAKLAMQGKWSELEEYQWILNGGRKKS